MRSLDLQGNVKAYTYLENAYSQEHRHYHTLEHIQHCLRHLDNVASQARKPYEIECALWFHDIIYNTHSTKNELKSAQHAQSFLQRNKVRQDIVARVYKLILATTHNSPPETADEALLVDIDLSILGAQPDTYNRFENNIRKEYSWVPYFLYRKKRAEVLTRFLSGDYIYHNAYFQDKFEAQARENLTTALAKLQ